MTKRRRQGWMLFLAGLLLLAGAWLLLRLLPGLDTTPGGRSPFYAWGWAAACSAAVQGSCWPFRP